jgi:hypothetical protein
MKEPEKISEPDDKNKKEMSMNHDEQVENMIKNNIQFLDEFLNKEKHYAETIIGHERPLENQIMLGGDGLIRNAPYLELRKSNCSYDFFQLFFNSKRVVIYNLVKNFRYFHKERNLLMQNLIHRSLIERVAYFYYMFRQTKNCKIGKYTGEDDKTHSDLDKLTITLFRGLTQSKIELVGTEFMNLNTDKFSEYTPKDNLIDKTSLNILTPINQLEKKFKGVLNSYYFLSEFLHPNVGDLWSASTRVQYTKNEFKDLYLKRFIGFGKPNYDDSYVNILNQCWEKLLEILKDYLKVLSELSIYRKNLRKFLSEHTHNTINKRSLKFFDMRKGTKCPCGSNLRVKDCMNL